MILCYFTYNVRTLLYTFIFLPYFVLLSYILLLYILEMPQHIVITFVLNSKNFKEIYKMSIVLKFHWGESRIPFFY